MSCIPCAASFVRLSNSGGDGPHVRFNLDLRQEEARRQFRVLCYAYEDSFDWSVLPLIFDSNLPNGVMRWQHGSNVVTELPIDTALAVFDERCHSLLRLE